MTKRTYRRTVVGLIVLVCGLSWILVHPKLYRKIHSRLKYEMIKGNVPVWVADWYNPDEYNRKR